ncbi:MAG: nuclear transport factor 2 family protein [Gemmatimonadaceae bacterium]
MTHRRLLLIRVLSLTVVAVSVTATPLAAQRARAGTDSLVGAPTATQRTLYRLEDQWAQGVVKRDAASLRRLVAPKWIYSDESGTMNREQGIASFTSGTDTVTAAGNDNMKAVVYGNTAIVTGILWMRGHNAQGAFNHRYRYTDTWMKLGGRWQCIASQDYLLPAEAP